MLYFTQGDLFKSEAVALVNAVNTVGTMGKGIALQFKQAFPKNFKQYAAACKTNNLQPGKLLAVWDESVATGKKLIINFPTKLHWKNPSQYQYVEDGLAALAKLIEAENIPSIALPALGCGNGGLNWAAVREMIVKYLNALPVDIYVYEPPGTP